MTGFLQRLLFGKKRKVEAERVLLEAVLEELARAKDAARVLIDDYKRAGTERDGLLKGVTLWHEERADRTQKMQSVKKE